MILPASLVWAFYFGFMVTMGGLTAWWFWRWAKGEGVKWAAKEWGSLRW